MIWKKREMPREWKATRPDLDNLTKAVKDALKKLVWVDDGQIAGDEAAHLEVEIVRLGPRGQVHDTSMRLAALVTEER